MIAQVFSSLRVLDRARSHLAYLRLPVSGEPLGARFESLATSRLLPLILIPHPHPLAVMRK